MSLVANRTTRNFLPRLYSKPDTGQLDGQGRTAAQVATAFGKDDVAPLLRGLSLWILTGAEHSAPHTL
jgi:hypothetical protein